MEFLVLIALAGYIYYLRNYADLRTKAEKEAASLSEGILLLQNGEPQKAFAYFDERLRKYPKSPVAHLYRARCYLYFGDSTSALKDLYKGLSFDDSVFELHLEIGKLYYNSEKYEDALQNLNKAIIKSAGKSAEAYHWRGLTHQKLNLAAEAGQDFATEEGINQSSGTDATGSVSAPSRRFDSRLLANSLLTILTTGLLLWMIKHAESIHLPYLVAAIASMSLGFVEPYKGWVLALLQGALLWVGYHLFTADVVNGAQQELENFSLYGSIILTFVGSFLGAFLKRAFNG